MPYVFPCKCSRSRMTGVCNIVPLPHPCADCPARGVVFVGTGHRDRVDGEEVAWLLLTSSNLSRSAWGFLDKVTAVRHSYAPRCFLLRSYKDAYLKLERCCV